MDKRTKEYRTLHLWFNKYTRAAFVAGIIFGSLIGFSLKLPTRTSPQAVKQTIQQVVADEPTPKELTWNDAIREIFPADEAGRMIRICMTENKSQNKYVMNINTNRSYDYSWCQVNSVHKPKSMTHSDWMKNLEDPMFNAQQVRKIYLSQGWSAWVVYNKGLVK